MFFCDSRQLRFGHVTKFSLAGLEKCTFLQASFESYLKNGFHRYYKLELP